MLALALAPQATFHSFADHVAVDAVVTDHKGRPVTGLTAADFTIEDAGRPQQIADFEYVSIPPHDAGASEAKSAQPTIDVATNERPSDRSRLFVIMIDDLHLHPQEIPHVKTAVTEFIEKLSPDDLVAVTFCGRSDVGTNFTFDRGRLMQVVGRLRSAFGFGIGPVGNAQGVFPVSAFESARTVLWDLRNIAGVLANSTHVRRAIIYVGGQTSLDLGAPVGSQESGYAGIYLQELEETFALARQADVPIYTLDPRGLVTPETASMGWGPTNVALRAELARRIRIQQDHLVEFADNTGGRAFVNRNDPAAAVDEIVADNSSFYELGFYPDPMIRDGQFHPLKVTVNRPGVTIRSRPGYWAGTPVTSRVTASPIDAASTAGLATFGVPLRVFVAALAPTATGSSVIFTADIQYPATADGAILDDQLTLRVLALDPDGKVKKSIDRTLAFKGAGRAGAAPVVAIDQALDVPRSTVTLRVVTASRTLGKTGSVDLPFEAPKFSDGRLQLTAPVIGVDAAHAPALDADTIAALVPFQPTTIREFRPSDTLRVFARALWGGKDEQVSAAIRIAGGALPPTTLSVSPQADGNGRHAGRIDARLPLAGLAAGRYTLVLDIQRGKERATRNVAFAIAK